MPELYGNTTGLSPSAENALLRIYRRKVSLERIASPELIRSLVEASKETRRQVGALVHRSGQVDYVIVGDANKMMLPDIGRLRAAEGRFRGLRLIHTHLYGEPLTRDDLVDLVRLRLDLVAALQLAPDGEVRGMTYAHNVPVSPEADADDEEETKPYRVVGPIAPGRMEVDFGSLIANLESEFARTSRTREVRAKDGRAILVHVGEKKKQGALALAEESLRELAELAATAGVEVVDSVLQIRESIDPRLVLGKGKLEDVLLRSAELDAETLIFDRDLSPSQASAIAKFTDLKIIDRSQLILDIFAQRAESSDGKLQVELAQLKYSLPRLGQKDDALSRLTGGIGGRGPGETTLEIGRRRAKERVTHLESQLRKASQRRETRRRHRDRVGIPIVSIVGYTNAGKSTLLNTLTKSQVLAEDKLFATLDTRSRRLRFPEEREVVLTDTVGFIRALPRELFAAFRATFEEAADADLLLHVVDASDPSRELHMQTTEDLLQELGLSDIPRIVVLNKADLLPAGEADRMMGERPDVVAVSALARETTRVLLDRIADHLAGRWEASARVPAPRASAAPTDGEGASGRRMPERTELTTLDELMGKKRKRKAALAGGAAEPSSASSSSSSSSSSIVRRI
jgi:GTPase